MSPLVMPGVVEGMGFAGPLSPSEGEVDTMGRESSATLASTVLKYSAT